MSDLPPESRPAPQPGPDPTPTRVLPPDRPEAGPRPRLADRVWSLRTLIAVALASVILGGLGGAALASVGDDDRDGRDGRDGPGRFHRGGPMSPEDMERWQERRREWLESRREWLERNRPPSG